MFRVAQLPTLVARSYTLTTAEVNGESEHSGRTRSASRGRVTCHGG
jgi:hypothetical protein